MILSTLTCFHNGIEDIWFHLLGPADQCWACQNHGRVYRVWGSTSQCLQQRRWPSGHDGWSVMWSFQQKCPKKLSCIENCRLNLHVCRSPGQKPPILRELLIIISQRSDGKLWILEGMWWAKVWATIHSKSMFSASCQSFGTSVFNIGCCNSKIFVYSEDVTLLNSVSCTTGWHIPMS